MGSITIMEISGNPEEIFIQVKRPFRMLRMFIDGATGPMNYFTHELDEDNTLRDLIMLVEKFSLPEHKGLNFRTPKYKESENLIPLESSLGDIMDIHGDVSLSLNKLDD